MLTLSNMRFSRRGTTGNMVGFRVVRSSIRIRMSPWKYPIRAPCIRVTPWEWGNSISRHEQTFETINNVFIKKNLNNLIKAPGTDLYDSLKHVCQGQVWDVCVLRTDGASGLQDRRETKCEQRKRAYYSFSWCFYPKYENCSISPWRITLFKYKSLTDFLMWL